MAPSAKRSLFHALEAMWFYPAWSFLTGAFFFYLAFIFSGYFAEPSGGAEEAIDPGTWGTMASHAFFGIVSFAVGIRMLYSRSLRRRLEQHFELSETTDAASADKTRRQIDAMVRMKDEWFLALLGLGFLVQAGIEWTAGNENLAYGFLLLVPMILIGFLISNRINPPERRELLANVSDPETAHLGEFQRAYGKQYLLLILINLVLAGAAFYLSNQSVGTALIAFLVGLVVILAITSRVAAHAELEPMSVPPER